MDAAQVQVFEQSLSQLERVQTLEADFVQYKHMSFMKTAIVSKGKLYLKGTNLLRWSYLTPFVYDMVFKDGKIQINDEGNKRSIDVGGSAQFEKISKLVSSSIRGGKYDQREFQVGYFIKDGVNMVRLTPKVTQAKKYFTTIDVIFSSTDKHIQEVVLTEPSKDYTRFVLSNKKINKHIDDTIFNL
ncbi:LolA-like outer-membrane lipoprotein carrier protein [Sphingobacterium sp. JB170]|nr:LolA-like outer-membrane lipoprotein carrier protein [Sphingobacterium sp. JB170]